MISFFTSIYIFVISFFPLPTWSHGLEGQPISFIPTEAETDGELMISNLVFRSLVNVDPFTGEVTNDLLDSYKVYEEGIAYDLTLKKNQYWHDGVEITADDLLYTASISSDLREVSSDRVDRYTVRFILPDRYGPFLSVLSLPLLPSHLDEKNNKLTPVGSGDYRVVRISRDRARIEEVILVSNSNEADFKRLVFRFYDSEEDLILGLRLREIDSTLYNTDEEIEGFRKLKKIFYGRSYLVVFNTEKDYLNKDARRKLISSLDFKELIQNQEYEDGIRPHGPFSGTWADSETYEQLNIESEVLADPFTDFEGSLSLIIPEISQARLIAENIKQQLERDDIVSIKITEVPRENYVGDIRDYDYDMVLLAHEYGKDPDKYIFWHSTQNEGGLNFTNFSAIRTDRSLEEGRASLDREERIEHYEIFQSVFAEEALAFYIVHPAQYFYYSNKISEMPENEVFYPWEVFINVKEWEKSNPRTIF